MRYDGQTMEYSFPDFSKMSMKGELGLQGELTGEFIPSVLVESSAAEGERKVPLEHHLEWTTLADAPSFRPSFRP